MPFVSNALANERSIASLPLFKKIDADSNGYLYSPTCWDTSSWMKSLVVFFLKIMGCGFGEVNWTYLRKVGLSTCAVPLLVAVL